MAHQADVTDTPEGFLWRVRRRSPLFQRTVSALVELSTEATALVWALSAHGDVAPDGMDWLLPAWIGVQGLVLGLVLVWEGRGRTPVRVVSRTPQMLRLDRHQVALADLRSVDVTIGGWGWWRSAEVVVRPAEGPPVRFAADGDDDPSLRRLVQRMDPRTERDRMTA